MSKNKRKTFLVTTVVKLEAVTQIVATTQEEADQIARNREVQALSAVPSKVNNMTNCFIYTNPRNPEINHPAKLNINEIG